VPASSEIRASVSLQRLIAFLVAGAFFMENLDGTVIATALPQMASSFHVSPVDLNLGMTAYMMTLAVFIPVSGWLADRFGPRTIFSSAIAIFTLASVLCGLTNSLWQFTAARIAQGIGGAMMVPVGRLVVLRITDKKNLMRSIACITWPGLMAPVIGPPVGGFITTYFTWRWIFFLNIPLGLLALGFALAWIGNERDNPDREFDWLGFGLIGTACVAVMYSLELMGQRSLAWGRIAGLLVYGAGAGAIAVRHMLRAPHPLLEFSSMKIRSFAISIAGGSLFRIAISVSPFLLPLMFQVTFGLSAFESGLLLLALFAGNLSMKTITTPVLRHYGFRTVLIVNGIASAVLIASFALLSPGTPRVAMLAVLFLHGLSRSLQFTAINTLAFAELPKAAMSSATSMQAVVHQMSMGMGVAVGAVALRAASAMREGRDTGPALADFHVAFVLVSLLALVAVADCFGLDRRAGAEVSGHAV
jgi:EmrB/QacA subfamily drug resistance transporter